MAIFNDDGYQLLILRHGKASTDQACQDFDRLLSQKGIEQTEHIGKWMRAQDLKPDWLVTSPAKRALMTADIVSKMLNIASQDTHIDSDVYGADLDGLFKVLASCSPKKHNILLIGHNPLLEYLIEFLLPEAMSKEQKDDLRMLPATLVHIEMNVDWTHLERHCAHLISITHGKFLH